MSINSDNINSDIEEKYADSAVCNGQELPLLRFLTCGSVDDGKSTLIGHMLYDAKLLYTDQEQALELESRVGSRDGKLDYSLLLDGLMAEREQGITIDVAYRYFNTDRRSFIVADCPGHEEYTRNMAVGASNSDLAVILLDVTKGVLPQTERHTRICDLMGIRHFVFVVNKMDLAGYDEQAFLNVKRDIEKLAGQFDPLSLTIIPTSATEGDNVTSLSENMPWYEGPALLPYLETVNVDEQAGTSGFVLPVQRISRPNADFRGIQGQVAAGTLNVGDEVTILPGGGHSKVSALYAADTGRDPSSQSCGSVSEGQAVTLCLEREVAVSRGDVLVKDKSLFTGMLFSATILWMDDNELSAGRNYLLKLGTKRIPATVLKIDYEIAVDDGSHLPADSLRINETGVCEIAVSDEIVYDRFRSEGECDRTLGTFLLIDRVSDHTSACGTIIGPLPRDRNLYPHEGKITRTLRSAQLGQEPLTIWFTGLSGSGKSSLANFLEERLFAMGKHTMLLDGDNIRSGMNRDLGFGESDRVENIRRIAEIAKLLNDAGIIVLVAFISPFERDRKNARDIVGDCFREIYVSTPLEVCEERDINGLYKKARAGGIDDFTGISSPYEVPENPDIVIDTTDRSVEDCVGEILDTIWPER